MNCSIMKMLIIEFSTRAEIFCYKHNGGQGVCSTLRWISGVDDGGDVHGNSDDCLVVLTPLTFSSTLKSMLCSYVRNSKKCLL